MVRSRDSEHRSAYEWRLRRLMDEYRSSGTVAGQKPRDAKHALALAKAKAAKE